MVQHCEGFAGINRGHYRGGRMPIRIVLAAERVIFRQGLKFILEEQGFHVVGEASNGQEIVCLAERLVPEVAVLDGGMPLLNGVDATKEIVKVSPKTKIILLTMPSENHLVMNALRAGARGYLLKERAAKELVQAVVEARGGIYLSPSISPSTQIPFLSSSVVSSVLQAYLTSVVSSVLQAYLTSTNPPLSLSKIIFLSGAETWEQVLQLVAAGKTYEA
jgi:DNA-binding NarL/FixJ family response regulator